MQISGLGYQNGHQDLVVHLSNKYDRCAVFCALMQLLVCNVIRCHFHTYTVSHFITACLQTLVGWRRAGGRVAYIQN